MLFKIKEGCNMKQFAEIEYLELEQNIEYEEIIQDVLNECFKEEKLESTNLYISITVSANENQYSHFVTFPFSFICFSSILK
jgi:hypothetical protein